MNIHYEELDDVKRYLDHEKHVGLEGRELQFRNILRAVRRFKTIDDSAKMIEVGTGTGWFPLLCQLNGMPCEGLEISPQLVQCAGEMAAKYNLTSTIRLGNLEDTDLGVETYDVVIASNVFEHVEDWRGGVHKIARALKPGGLMFFESTNKFSITSGEYSGFPTYICYGWLPDSWRYALRKAVHGPDIMKLGIDFHQFRHSLLRREFEKAGFQRILDRIEMADEASVSSGFRKQVVRWARQFPPAKALALTFCEATRFVCLK